MGRVSYATLLHSSEKENKDGSISGVTSTELLTFIGNVSNVLVLKRTREGIKTREGFC